MSTGSKKQYDFPQKNHWRRRTWNALIERTNGRYRNEFVLYLAGAEDLDRAVAMRKGVPSRNLIAIERDAVAANRLRRTGALVLEGDLLDILWAWPAHRPVCAIHADYCSGVEFANLGLYDVLARAPLRKAIVVLNLMRGRDPYFNTARDLLTRAGVVTADVKHRGELFLTYHAFDSLQTVLFGTYLDKSEKAKDVVTRRPICIPKSDADRERWRHITAIMVSKQMKATFFSYRSGTLMMDTAVFNHSSKTFQEDGIELTQGDGEMREIEDFYNFDPSIRRTINAIMAVRTRMELSPLPHRSRKT